MGAGPHPTRPRRRLWGKKSLLQSWKMRTKKRTDFKTLWLKWGQSQNLLKQTESTVRQAWFDSLCWLSFVLQRVFLVCLFPLLENTCSSADNAQWQLLCITDTLGFIQNHRFLSKISVFTKEVQQELVTSTPRRGCLSWDHPWVRAGKGWQKGVLQWWGFCCCKLRQIMVIKMLLSHWLWRQQKNDKEVKFARGKISSGFEMQLRKGWIAKRHFLHVEKKEHPKGCRKGKKIQPQ